jgi:predicted flap endonuclease-1-like 5' DNA nuclease
MSGLACLLWWLVLGALLGLVGSWLIGRMLRSNMPPPAERIVEKFVDRPVEKVVEKIVEKVVEKKVDNPDLLAQIATLTATAALVPQLRNQLSAAQATPAKVVERVVEKIVDRPVDRVVEKIVPDTAALEERDRRLRSLQLRIEELEASERRHLQTIASLREPPIDIAAAKAAGFTIKGADDLEIIEGIGPKIADLLRAAGVRTFAQLAAMKPAAIQPILDAAGPNYKLADPQTWPEQSALAARNQWRELRTLQDDLNAGKR